MSSMKVRLKAKAVTIQNRKGIWCEVVPYAVTVKGGQAVVFLDEAGNEVRRVPLAKYLVREGITKEDFARLQQEEKSFDEKVQSSVGGVLGTLLNNEKLSAVVLDMLSNERKELEQLIFNKIKFEMSK